MTAAAPGTRRGRCLCGAVRFRAEGAPKWVAHCHCESCRRQTASPFTTFAGYLRERVAFEGEAPAHYGSSPGVTRRFCGRCGTPVAYEGARWPDEVHLYVSIFERPDEFAPQAHVNTAEQLPWIRLDDGLKRVPRIGG